MRVRGEGVGERERRKPLTHCGEFAYAVLGIKRRLHSLDKRPTLVAVLWGNR